jgi:hypothetical protein
MTFQLTFGTLGAIIVEAKFPSNLREGEKITGTLKIKNPFSDEGARALIEAYTLWDNHYFACIKGVLTPSGEVTVNFPVDFTAREPIDAPDPVMPNADAAIYFLVTMLSESATRQQTESLTVVIKLAEIVTAKIAGIPVWALLILLPLSGLFSYVLYKKYRKRL